VESADLLKVKGHHLAVEDGWRHICVGELPLKQAAG
jgi:hypothetical protein